MILNKEDALYVYGVFEDFFHDIERIDDYMRKIKLERMENFPSYLPNMGPENDFFDRFDMNPEDMEFQVVETDIKTFMTYLEITASHSVEANIPGRQLLFLVKEKKTNAVVGMIRFGSPTINSKPRNAWLGRTLDSSNKEMMDRFNESVMMGFIIVPVQPFGYNYLGGKLLAALCCSHEIREKVNAVYDMNVCMFETTSLYGNLKSSSQYDGMKPFMRYIGLTDSNHAPLLNDKRYKSLHEWFKEKNGGVPLTPNDATSKKMKRQARMIAILKNSLLEHDVELYQKFCEMIEKARGLTQQKRSYYSTYGFENVQEYLALETDELKPADNFDRYYFDNIVDWWKKKASKRYEKLKRENRLRTKIETWNTNPEEIDIIR